MQKLTASIVITAALAQAAHSAEPNKKWFEEMKIGPAWSNTFCDEFKVEKDNKVEKFEVGRKGEMGRRTAALKGILLDLGEENHALFDTETLRLVTAYQGGINWGGTPWTGAHGVLIGLKNEKALFNTGSAPGWADASGSFEDKREIPGYGNLKHASYKGYFRHGSAIVLDYLVHGAPVLENVSSKGGVLTRSFQLGKRESDLVLFLADEAGAFTVEADGSSAKSPDGLAVFATGGAKLSVDAKMPNRLLATFAKGDAADAQIAFARGAAPKPAAAPDFKALTAGGPALYPEIIETKGIVSGDKNEPYVTDIVTLPTDNPWKANLRFGGFDFIDEDSAALSSWNGDVWVVKGLKGDWSQLKWQRIASGLFETLGLKVVDKKIYVNGRDQITQLIDLNGDGETDHFKVFNRDVIISSNFHEFAFDLQTDTDGNFYFAKASPVRGGGRGFDRILPHHGVIAKISPDGSKFEVVATGLRAPGGMGVGPNGELTTGENEGTWQPACKINFATKAQLPVFFGTEDSRHDLTAAPFTEPLCYMPMDVDNSGGGQVWVPKTAKFGVDAGDLLHLSYGQSTIYRVLPVPRGKTLEGGVVKLPIKLQSSAMRARFHTDGSMYVVGFRGWQTNAATEAAFQRVRYNEGAVVPVPNKLEYTKTGVRLHFAESLDAELANDPTSFSAERWNYVRGPQYGSGQFSVDKPDAAAEKAAMEGDSKAVRVRDTVEIESAKIGADGKSVELALAGWKPTMQLKVSFDLEGKEGEILKGDLYSTVYPD